MTWVTTSVTIRKWRAIRGDSGRFGAIRGGTAALFLTLLSSNAHSAFSQAMCPSPVPNIPVDVGSTDFNFDVNDPGKYAHQQHHEWPLMVNSNIDFVAFSYQNFNSEQFFDYLDISHETGTLRLMGNLGTNYFFARPIPEALYFWVRWHSDYSNNRPGRPRLHIATPFCKPTAQPTVTRLVSVNRRLDGLLIASSDVIYIRFVQPASTRVTLTVDVVAASAPSDDFDLYASTTTSQPDNVSYQWKDTSGNPSGTLDSAGAAIVIPSVSWQRTVYAGVRSYRGAGHFIVRANVAKTGSTTPNIVVCTPGLNLNTSPFRDNVVGSLKGSLLRMTQLTHGNYQPTGLTFKQISEVPNDLFCSTDSSCKMCMCTPITCPLTPQGEPDHCPIGQSLLGLTNRIAFHNCAQWTNNPDGAGLVTAHELGHSIFGVLDEYSPWGIGLAHHCGHSIMNGPNGNSDRFCTRFNHCFQFGINWDGQFPAGGMSCSPDSAAWSHAPYGLSFATTLPNPTTWSAQPWPMYFRNTRARALLTTTYQ